MRNRRNLRGKGLLVCGDETANVWYEIDLFTDESGHKRITGVLRVNTSFALKAAVTPSCRLILKTRREIAVRIELRDDGSCGVENAEGFT